MPPAPIVFFDISAPGLSRQTEFYSKIFDWEISETGAMQIPFIGNPNVHATLRADPAEKLLYLGVDDINATLEAVTANGGEIDQPRFEVPGVVILGLFKDPGGNRMGLVEMENGVAKVP